MGLGNDFLAVVAELWDIEQFDMWNPDEHGALAYAFDCLYETSDFGRLFEQWLALARAKEFNELAWSISQAIVDAARADERLSPEELGEFEAQLGWQREYYDDGTLSGFAFVNEAYYPDWFFELFGVYSKMEELKRETAILACLKGEFSMSPERAEAAYKKLATHPDILNEFYFYANNGRFISFDPITAEGYSAQGLCETTYLSPIGAYNYLIYLREHPEEALQDLKDGLPRK